MYTYLTPEPLTIEIRNAAGDIHLDLSGTATTTTVEVTAVGGRPFGFLDDVFRAIGQGPGRGGGWGFVTGLGAGSGESGQTEEPDPATLVRVEHTADGEDGGVLIVDTDPARSGRRSAFEITVTAPLGSSVRVQSQSSDVEMTGTADKAEIRTASGDVRLADVRSDLLVHTASGDISVHGAAAGLDVRTASGDISVGSVGGDALLHTTSGNVRVGAVGGNLTARSVSGDVVIDDATSGHAQVDAVSGDVEIGVHHGSRASVALTTISGQTDTDLEVSNSAPEGEPPALDITVRTTSGDIRLRRAA